MSAPRFHFTGSLSRADVGSEVLLPDAVAHHATRVLRLGVGECLTLFTGAGGEFAATLVRADKRGTAVRIEAFVDVDRESPLALTLVQAIPAADAMDHVVRKAVELGVHAIAPVSSARSAPLPTGMRADKRRQHWQQVIVAACEQSGRNRLPELQPIRPLAEWAASWRGAGVVCVPDVDSDWGALDLPVGALAIAVGPEGGFTTEEVALLRARGLAGVRMGPRVLRTETAAVAALAIAQLRFGDGVRR
jgi:16S rRNA (uracil1498-N3)-methyltransferase